MIGGEGSSRPKRLAVAAAAIALTTVGAPSATSTQPAKSPSQAEPAPQVQCVKARRAGAYAVEGSVKAVRAALRPRTMTNQSGEYRLTPGNYSIARVSPVSLGAERGTAERRLAELVRSRCGLSMSEQTWLVIVHFPRSTLAVGTLELLMTRTGHGWRVVYEGRGRG